MKLVSVRILDHEYHIRSDASGETVLRIAEYVNQQLDTLRANSFTGTHTDLAIMVALKAASDLFQTKADLARLREKVEQMSASLTERIDDNLTRIESGSE